MVRNDEEEGEVHAIGGSREDDAIEVGTLEPEIVSRLARGRPCRRVRDIAGHGLSTEWVCGAEWGGERAVRGFLWWGDKRFRRGELIGDA